MKRFRQRKAFTIVEMVIVIAVIAILATVLVPTISGVIQKANHSADQQFVASLNVQLALWQVDNGEITNESDLREAINWYYGDEGAVDFYATLSPKSAPQGYHYWWDATDKTVVLAKYEDLLPKQDEGQPALIDNENVLTFSPASPRSLEINGKNYFLMDRGEGHLAQLMASIEMGDAGDFEAALTNVYNLAKHKGETSIEAQILEKVRSCAIITDAGAFRYADITEVKGVYIPVTTKTFASLNVYTYTITDDGVAVDDGDPAGPTRKVIDTAVTFELPSGIIVNAKGLVGFVNPDDTSDLLTGTPTVLVSDNDLSKIFSGDAADCVIQTPDGTRYIIKLGQNAQGEFEYQYCRLPDGEVVGSLPTGGDDVNITVEIGHTFVTNQMVYDPNGKILYVAYDEGGVQLNVKDSSLAGSVTWSVPENDLLSIDEYGKVIFKTIPAVDNANPAVTVTASVPIAGGTTKQDTITIHVCRINNADFTIAGASGGFDLPALDESLTEITITYEDNNKFAISAPALGYNGFNPDELAIKFPNAKLTATTTGDLFSINEDCTELTVDASKIADNPDGQKVTFTYAVGTTVYAQETYTIKVFDNTSKAFEVKKGPDGNALSSKYLYRVGNSGAIKLSQLFTNEKPTEYIKLEIIDVNTGDPVAGYDASKKTLGAEYAIEMLTLTSWKNSEIKFSGTGVATVKISTMKLVKGENGEDDSYETVATTPVHLEIVDGKNVTAYSELKNATNYVLLGNIELTSGSQFKLSNGALYGNGYTFDVSKGPNVGINGDSNGLIILTDADLDNVKIVGAPYQTYTEDAIGQANAMATVQASGESNIYNCFISKCMSPVRVLRGNVTIENTTLWGGAYANLDIRSGEVTVKNLTTVNQETDGYNIATDGAIGGGIAFWYESSSSAMLYVDGTLTQYNNVSSSNNMTGYCKQIAGVLLDMDQFLYNGTANTGIMAASGEIDADNVKILNTNIGYTGTTVTVAYQTRYYWTKVPTADTYQAQPSAWKPSAQHIIAPDAEIDNTVNDEAKTDGSNVYCYYDFSANKLLISFDEGGSKEFDPNILVATKHGHTLEYTVTIGGTDYTNDGTVDKAYTITFNQAGEYTMVLKYRDSYNYAVTDGVLNSTDKWYEMEVTISVTAVKLDAKDPVFQFHGYNSIGTTPGQTWDSSVEGQVITKEDSNGNTWIMPAATGTYSASTTIAGITVNAPKVYTDFQDHSSDFSWLYPFFTGVTISDYANEGTAANATIVADSTTKTKPTNFTLVSDSAVFDTGLTCGNSSTGHSEGSLPTSGVTNGAYKGLYGFISCGKGSDTSENTVYAQFSYKSNKGDTYYYCIAFVRGAHNKPTSCFTPDTLITLADGTQKEIQHVSNEDMLLVWDFYTGQYSVVPAAVLINHGMDEYTIITLKFDDGTEVKVVECHEFFNVDANKWAFIDENNVADYVGTNFIRADGDSYTTVKLVDYSVHKEVTEAYSIFTAVYYNCFAENMLSLTPSMFGSTNYYVPFEIGEDLKYDEEAMQADIEKYGLYTYEDFSDYVTYEQFVGFNAAYFKVSVGKGLVTYEQLIQSIFEYVNAE